MLFWDVNESLLPFLSVANRAPPTPDSVTPDFPAGYIKQIHFLLQILNKLSACMGFYMSNDRIIT